MTDAPTPSSASSRPERQGDATPSPTERARLPRHLLMQAPVEPVDVDGLVFVTVGTIVFALTSVLLAVYYPTLAPTGRGWWLGVAISGVFLGLIGLAYAWNRRRRRRRSGPLTSN